MTKAKRKPLFTTYRLKLQVRSKILGGTPRDPKIIQAWIKTKAGITKEAEIKEMMIRTLQEQGVDNIHSDNSLEEINEAVAKISKDMGVNGFKKDDNGIYIESRQVKAMLKEAVAILFPYQAEKWGATKKAPKSFFTERVFPTEDKIYLGKKEADGIHQVIGHLKTPQGPRSAISYYEYAEQPVIEFDLKILRDSDEIDWEDVLEYAGENGLGASRSQGNGRFDVLSFKKIK
jgi:hypothetical protein